MPRIASPSRVGLDLERHEPPIEALLRERLLDQVMRRIAGHRVGDQAAFFDERGAGHDMSNEFPCIKPRPAVAKPATGGCRPVRTQVRGLAGLKGRNMIAQGAALGTGRNERSKP